MKKLSLFFVVLVVVTPAAALDFPEIEGWTPDSEVSSYDSDSLWEYINGAAETFMQYGFQGLETAELSRDGVTVAVSIYDMGTPINAYGIYRTELPDDTKPLSIGAQAVVSPPYQALMAKDRFYVKVDVYDGEMDDVTGKVVLETVARSLPGSNGMPAEFSKLPTAGRADGSEQFVREGFLGLAELSRCVSAEYEDGRKLFVVLPAPGSSADATWNTLASKWMPVAFDGAPVLAKKVPYTGFVGVIRKGDGIIGVVGAENETELVEILSLIK